MTIDYNSAPNPCYILEADLLRRNLKLIKDVETRSGATIILAFKAFALWKAFPIVKEYFNCATASSLSEAMLANEELGAMAHTFAPAYTDEEFPKIAALSSHLTFNSLSQFERLHAKAQGVSYGLRVNPEYSAVETDLYNPCVRGSRLGVLSDDMPEELPKEIEGLHFHALCEGSAEDLENTLTAFENRFAHWIPQVKWVNFGGGHLMTRKGYNVEHLINIIKAFRKRWGVEVILEPGSAFAWQTGVLTSKVVDIVKSGDVTTAILNVSFACHMPDCLEMPYKPNIRGAHNEPVQGLPTYRMGGNSCLAGDYVGDWSFDKPLQIGDTIVFEDMIHYTTVKTTMFNGVSHPSIAIFDPQNGGMKVVREFGYEDYKSRMS